MILFGEGNIEPDKVRETKVNGICTSAACMRQCVHAVRSTNFGLSSTLKQYRDDNHDVSNVMHTAQLACLIASFCIQHRNSICLYALQEQTGRWPLLLSWFLDSLSHQTPLPVAQYEERGQLRETI